MKKTFLIIALYFLFVFSVLPANGQQADKTSLSAAEKSEVLEKAFELLNKNYLFPETARKMETLVREKDKNGEYEKITDARDFALRLTGDLQSVSRDRHLRVTFSPEVLPADPENIFEPPKEMLERIRQMQARENFGVAKIEILKGNIGLIRIDYFTNPEWAGGVYTAAISAVADTDALILDLRQNGGSMHEDAIPFLCSYFFEKAVHLNDIYWRPKNETRQFWTYAQVPGRRYLDKPIYILTSSRTFSGAEEIAYDLKNLKRATIVGETTGGGAHGGGDRRISDHFSIWVPMGRAINPVTKTNWEGTGVAPDIETASNKALYRAQLEALGHLLKTQTDAQWKQVLENARSEIDGKLENFRIVSFRLKGFETAQKVTLAGDFNGWSPRGKNLTRDEKGLWTTDVELEPGRYEYKFIVDGRWISDPENSQKAGPHQNSVMTVGASF